MEEALNEISNRVRAWREGLGLSLHELAARSDVAASTIQKVETGQMVPSIAFGVATADPTRGLFTTANFPGASNDQLGEARGLFGLLTGRVTSFGGNIVLNDQTNQYEYLGSRKQAGRQNEYSVFAQDSWRVTPTLTINAGVRWDVQMPFEPVNDVLSTSFLADACGISAIGPDGRCVFFTPGASGGKQPSRERARRVGRGQDRDRTRQIPECRTREAACVVGSGLAVGDRGGA